MLQYTRKNKKAVLKKTAFFLKQIAVFIFLFTLSFISWNYIGILFAIYIYYILRELHRISNNQSFMAYFKNIFVLIFAWHLGALFWMFKLDKGLAAFTVCFILYLIPFILYFPLRKFIRFPMLTFIPFYFLFELIINKSILSFPWLTIGNVLSNQWYLVQWYSFTSVLGGSIWLLTMSYLCVIKFKYTYIKLIIISLLFVIPVVFSLFKYFNNDIISEKNEHLVFVTFNPEMYDGDVSNNEIAYHLWDKLKYEKQAKALLIPEQTFRGINYKRLKKSLVYKYLSKIVEESSIQVIYIGTTIQIDKSITNSGVFIVNDDTYLKVKRKLVPYTEFIASILKNTIFKKKRSFNYKINDSTIQIEKELNITALVCYEAMYPFKFISKKSQNGNVIYLISSEFFFNHSSFGKRQYNNIIRLRAIESKSILVKSSSYGKSFILDYKGNILSSGNNEFNYLSK